MYATILYTQGNVGRHRTHLLAYAPGVLAPPGHQFCHHSWYDLCYKTGEYFLVHLTQPRTSLVGWARCHTEAED